MAKGTLAENCSLHYRSCDSSSAKRMAKQGCSEGKISRIHQAIRSWGETGGPLPRAEMSSERKGTLLASTKQVA